jgi:malate synthase
MRKVNKASTPSEKSEGIFIYLTYALRCVKIPARRNIRRTLSQQNRGEPEMVAPSPLFPVNRIPSPDELPAGFLDFLRPLDARFTPSQRALADWRTSRLQAAHVGKLPYFRSVQQPDADWFIKLPDWISDQRNQMTGPADEAALVVKMLNSGAPGVMIDLEDSEANFWPNLKTGLANAVAALHGTLTYEDSKRGGTVGIKPSNTVGFVRPRGLHMSQWGVFPDEPNMPVSASLFDVAYLVHQLDFGKLKHPLCIYIPKSESAEEALWWRDLFQTLARQKDLPPDGIKCMALVESHPLAYEMEDFIWNLRDHILGLNLGRWDYMASLIHYLMSDPQWVLPDRNTIPHDVPFFQRLRELMVEICHRRGILAIGGMTALFPDKEDPEHTKKALAVLARDKANEAAVGMDGAWTGHPAQNEIAVAQFPFPNQLRVRRLEFPRYPHPNLLPVPKGVGTISLEGTRAAVHTAILYRAGMLAGRGASLLKGYMEDLATDRICRLMIEQRVRHDVCADGVRHTASLITRLFDEGLESIIGDLHKRNASPETVAQHRKARQVTEEMIIREEFDPS